MEHDRDQRIAEYFVVSGLPDNPQPYDFSQMYSQGEEIATTNSVDFSKYPEPIVDIGVVNAKCKEVVPPGYTLIDRSYYGGNKADLNGFTGYDEMYLCYRRGRDKPPITDIGIVESSNLKPRVTVEVINKTVGGRSANVLNSMTSALYFSFRRALPNAAVNNLAVTDICVILMNKGETCPPAYNKMDICLNQLLGNWIGNKVYVCYKKSLVKEHVICYTPALSCVYPPVPGLPLDPNVPSQQGGLSEEAECIRDVAAFCLPWGATLEAWEPTRMHPSLNFHTFVLTNSQYRRLYGGAITFYEPYDVRKLTADQRDTLLGQGRQRYVYVTKAICLLSRWPFFTAFKKFLIFLHSLVTSHESHGVPLEKYISFFLHQIPFPTVEMPNILLQLENDAICLQLPEKSVSNTSGENFVDLIKSLSTEQIVQLLLYMLTEQKILLTSLRHKHLTDIAEALISIIFPFRWTVVYIPFLYLSCIHIIQSPSPYLIGVDSRFFDFFTLPDFIACVDLDTKNIKIPKTERNLDIKMFPKRSLKVLMTSLDEIRKDISTFDAYYADPNHRASDDEFNYNRKRSQLGVRIKECFLRFMASLLKDYSQYLCPVNASKSSHHQLFNTEGYLKSFDRPTRPLIQALYDTQLWSTFVQERSYQSSWGDSLAFFDRCVRLVSQWEREVDIKPDTPLLNLIETDKARLSESTKVITPPEPDPANTSELYNWKGKFPQLSLSLFPSLPPAFSTDDLAGSQDGLEAPLSISASQDLMADSWPSLIAEEEGRKLRNALRRSAHEVTEAHVKGKEAHASKDPSAWGEHLLVSVYALWYMILPSYISSAGPGSDQPLWAEGVSDLDAWGTESHSDWASNMLVESVDLLNRLLDYDLDLPDEVPYRVVVLLWQHYECTGRTDRLRDMVNRIHLNAITYGLFNQILLEQGQLNESKAVSEMEAPKKKSGDTLSLGSYHMLDHNTPLHRTSSDNNCDMCYLSRPPAAVPPCTVLVPQSPEPPDGISREPSTASTATIQKPSSSLDEDELIFEPGSERTNQNIDRGYGTLTREELVCQEAEKSSSQTDKPLEDRQSIESGIETTEKLCTASENSIEITDKLCTVVDRADLTDAPNEKENLSTIEEKITNHVEKFVVDINKSSAPAQISQLRPASTSERRRNRNRLSTIVREGSVLIGDQEDPNTMRASYHDNNAGILMSSCQHTGRQDNRSVIEEGPNCPPNNDLNHKDVPTEPANENQNVSIKAVSIAEPENASADDQDKNLDHKHNNTENNEDTESTNKLEMHDNQENEQNNQSNSVKQENDPNNESSNHDDTPSNNHSSQENDTSNQSMKQTDQLSTPVISPKRSTPSPLLSVTPSSDPLGALSAPMPPPSAPMPPAETPKTIQENMPLFKPTVKVIPRGGRPSASNPFSEERSELHRFYLSPREQDQRSEGSSGEERRASTPDWDQSSESSRASGEVIHSALNSFKRAPSLRGFRSVAANTMQSFISQVSRMSPAVPLSSDQSTIPGNMRPWQVRASTPSNSNAFDVTDSPSTPTNSMRPQRSASLAPSSNPRYKKSLPDAISANINERIIKEDNFTDLWLTLTGPLTYPPPSSLSLPLSRRLLILLNSCSTCPACEELIYEEEIQQNWAPDENNLNTRCPFCTSSCLPQLTLRINYQTFQRTHKDTVPGMTSSASMDLCSTSSLSASLSNDHVPSKSSSNLAPNPSPPIITTPLTSQAIYQNVVPYLSPFVLRKELETLVHREGDEGLKGVSLLSDHDVLFWNLLWTCRRVGLPSHLLRLVLLWIRDEQRKTPSRPLSHPQHAVFSSLLQSIDLSPGVRVEVHTKWDASLIHGLTTKPLYQQWGRKDNLSMNALLTDVRLQRSPYDLMKAIVNAIVGGDMPTAVDIMIKYRKANAGSVLKRSIYREILFLVLTVVTPTNLNQNVFDEEYEEVFRKLKRLKEPGLLPVDTPPKHRAVWCRRLFQTLEL